MRMPKVREEVPDVWNLRNWHLEIESLLFRTVVLIIGRSGLIIVIETTTSLLICIGKRRWRHLVGVLVTGLAMIEGTG